MEGWLYPFVLIQLIKNKLLNQWLDAAYQRILYNRTLDIIKEEAVQEMNDDDCVPRD